MTRYPVKSSTTRGFTIIEAIIAVGIIGSALIVGLSLAYSNLTSAQENNQRIIATQLAREALEVVRNVRDSNWLKRAANYDKDGLTNGIQLYNFNDDTGGVPLTNYVDIMLDQSLPHSNYMFTEQVATSDLLPCIQAGTAACRVQKKDGVYFQNSLQVGEFTPFYRRVTLKPICYKASVDFDFVDFDPAAADMLCSSGNPMLGFVASADVIWKRGGDKISEIQAKERFYDWRK